MEHRAGKKIGGRHTTIIDAARPIVDLLQRLPEVTKLSPGFIKLGLRSGRHRLKISLSQGGLLLKIRGSTSIQEVRIYTDDVQATKNTLRDYNLKAGGLYDIIEA
jgi:hypothetical protein